MRSPFAYSPRPGPVGSAGPGSAAAYLGVLAGIALVFANPIVIAGAGAAVVLSGLASNAAASLRTAARWALSLGLLIVLVNGLVVRRGDTVLVRGFDVPVLGQLDVTLEALAEGAVLGLRVVVVLLAFAVFSACVDPDRMLGALRPIARRSAITATLITRLVPLAARDHARLREAASLRGPVAAQVGRAATARRLVAGSLDRAADVAATLELRGYGLAPPSSRPRERGGAAAWSANGSSVLLVLLAVISGGVALGARLAGVGSFDAYPTIRIDADAPTIALALLIALSSLMLFTRKSVARSPRWAVHPRPGEPLTEEPARSAGPHDSSLGLAQAGGPVLEFTELTYRYPAGERDAIKALSLEIRRGELVLVAGESGSGKTSVLRAACGLIPHFHGGVIRGRVRIAGHDLREGGPSELAAAAGFVAQDPETQVVSALAGSELELPLVSRGQPFELRTARLVQVATELGIAHLLERTSDSLSAGELQRVAIAAALVASPELLLLDEPTSQLDPEGAQELTRLVQAVRARGTAVLVAEHRLGRWLAIADRLAVMDDGRLVFDGDPLESRAVGVSDDDLARQADPANGERALPLANGRHRTADSVRRSRAEPALDLSALSVELTPGAHPALRGVELSVDRGERVVLLGPNGAGKTTLLRACAGAVEPASGQASAPGGCALLGQHPGDYIVHERVADELPGTDGAAALASVGLAWAADRDPRDLSGGERQRLALAIALAGRGIGGEAPGLVCLDEPTRGMDPARKKELGGLIKRLSSAGAAVLVATHDLRFAAEFAGRAIVLDHGVISTDTPFANLVREEPPTLNGAAIGLAAHGAGARA